MFGQAFFPSDRGFRLSNAAGVVCLLLLAACSGDPGEPLQSGRVLPWAGPEGRWVGPVSPIDSGCGPESEGLLSIGGGAFAFDPFQSTTVLHGTIDPAGNVSGEAVRQISGGKSVTIGFVGRVQHTEPTDKIIGMLTSGRCHWAVALSCG